MKNRVAKLLSIFLVIALLVGASPVRLAVYAEEDDQATETKTENAEGDKDKGSDEDKTPTPKTAPESQKDKTEADKSTPTPEPDDQKESQAPTADGDKEGDPDKTPTQEPQTTEKPEPGTDNGEGEETAISETTPAPETHKIPGKAGSTGGNPVYGYTLTLNPNYEGAAVGMYNDITTMVLPSAKHLDWTFLGWAESKNGEVKYEAGKEITLTGDLTLYAIWKPFTVTVDNGTGSGTYAPGAIVTITANAPETNMRFVKWTGADGLTFIDGDAASSTLTFIMPEKDVTLMATFVKLPLVIVIHGTGSGYYAPGASVTITANAPEAGKQFKEWTGTDGLTFTNGDAASSTLTFTMPANDVTLTATYEDLPIASYSISPSEYTLNGSGYTDIICTLTSLELGYVRKPRTDEYVKAKGIEFYMNAGVLSDGYGHSIPFQVDDQFHLGHEKRKYQGNGYGSQGKTLIMAIYVDPKDYANAVPGTYKGTFTYDSFWNVDGDDEFPNKSGSIELTLVVPEYVEYTIKVNNGSADPAKALVGTVIKLTADEAPSGKVFDKWVVNAESVSLSNVSSSTATFTMPAENVEVTATYKDVPAGSFVIKINNGDGNTTSLISAPGLVVNVKANDAPAGTEFEKWEVVSGTVIFANASSAATIFVMPAENVEITARYKSSLSVKGKTATVKYSKVKKKNQTLSVSKVLTFVNKGQGKLTYAKVSGNSKISINKTTGTVTVKKKLKKKTYTVKVKVQASGNDSCNPSGWKTVTFKIKVK